jgi:prepilin-type N-terminal cleavage/methylation domain-containing protein
MQGMMDVMVIFKKRGKSCSGFTFVELMVAIAIIAVLSTVVIASISGARSRYRDNQRKLDLKQIQLGLERYFGVYGTYLIPSTGYNGGGQGWLALENGPLSTYATSTEHALKNLGYLGSSVKDDPTQNPGYMIYTCNSGATYAISATLENPAPSDIAFIQTTCNGSGVNGTYSTYGKNYALTNSI